MNVRRFMLNVLPRSGYKVAAQVLSGKPQHRVRDTVDELLHEAALLDSSGADAYFGVGTLTERRKYLYHPDGTPVMAESGGRTYHKYATRVLDNIAAIRTFHMDVDVHPSGTKGAKPVYDSTNAALSDIKALGKALQLPRPSIVASGSGGIHVYWLIEEDVPPSAWRPVAANFRAIVAATCARVADLALLDDPTRVYRVPGTHRHADGSGTEVRILCEGSPYAFDRYSDIFAKAAATLPAQPSRPAVPAVPAYLSGLPANILPREYPPLDLDLLLSSCQVIRHAYDNQATIAEPVWRAALMTVRLCSEPEAVHWLSMDHPEYSREATEAKVDSIRAEGAATCAHYDAVTGGGCAGCPHQGAIASPAALAYNKSQVPPPRAPVPNAQIGTPAQPGPVLPNPPAPYIRTASGKIAIEVENADGIKTLEIVSEYDMYPTHLVSDKSENEEHTLWQIHLPVQGWVSAELPASAFSDGKKLLGELLRKGVYTSPGNGRRVHAFMVAYLQTLQKHITTDRRYSKLGWNEKDSIFVLNNKIISDTGITVSSAPEEVMRVVRGVGTSGTLDGWKAAMDFYSPPELIAHQFCAMAGFASVLMPFSGFRGVVLNLDGPPGAGKTTVLNAINSIWGNTTELLISGGKSGSTVAGRYQKFDTHNNLPVTMDEITTLQGEEASLLVHSASQGIGRQRAKGFGGLETWCNILACSSNGSLYHKISGFKANSAGENVRIFEVTMTHMDTRTKAEADRFNSELRTHYGHAGELFAQYLVKHRQKLPAFVAQCMLEIDRRASVHSGERFRAALVGVVWAAAKLVHKLGLLPWSPDAIADWGVAQLNALRDISADYTSEPLGVISEFLDNNMTAALVLMNATGKTGMADVLVRPTSKLQIRHEPDKGLLYIQSAALKEYCVRSGADYQAIKQNLRDRRILLDDSCVKSLGSHTPFEKVSTRCWLIDMHHPDIAGTLPQLVAPMTNAASATP